MECLGVLSSRPIPCASWSCSAEHWSLFWIFFFAKCRAVIAFGAPFSVRDVVAETDIAPDEREKRELRRLHRLQPADVDRHGFFVVPRYHTLVTKQQNYYNNHNNKVLSYYIGETLLFTIYTHYSNLI